MSEATDNPYASPEEPGKNILNTKPLECLISLFGLINTTLIMFTGFVLFVELISMYIIFGEWPGYENPAKCFLKLCEILKPFWCFNAMCFLISALTLLFCLISAEKDTKESE